jgi:hypothetical protein
VETERAISEANVEIIRRHYEIRHGKGGKRREVAAAASLVPFAAFLPARWPASSAMCTCRRPLISSLRMEPA